MDSIANDVSTGFQGISAIHALTASELLRTIAQISAQTLIQVATVTASLSQERREIACVSASPSTQVTVAMCALLDT